MTDWEGDISDSCKKHGGNPHLENAWLVFMTCIETSFISNINYLHRGYANNICKYCQGLVHWATGVLSPSNLLLNWKLHEVTTKAWLFRLGFPFQSDNSRGLCLADRSQMVKGELFLLHPRGRFTTAGTFLGSCSIEKRKSSYTLTTGVCVRVCVTNTFLLMDITNHCQNYQLFSWVM